MKLDGTCVVVTEPPAASARRWRGGSRPRAPGPWSWPTESPPGSNAPAAITAIRARRRGRCLRRHRESQLLGLIDDTEARFGPIDLFCSTPG